LTATATLVDPADPALLLRLPLLVQVPSAFPVLVRITPPAGSALSFSGVVDVYLHTHNLELDPGNPQSVLKSPNGGLFQDITSSEAPGSYRVCGSGGGFSDFVIVEDHRLTATVVLEKFTTLQATLVANSARMPLLVFLTLQTRLNEARSLFDLGNLLGAISKVTSFSNYAAAHSGSDIPNVWRANDPGRVNVAGLLRSGADTLKFSLLRSTP
jgi:hypothetical protein